MLAWLRCPFAVGRLLERAAVDGVETLASSCEPASDSSRSISRRQSSSVCWTCWRPVDHFLTGDCFCGFRCSFHGLHVRWGDRLGVRHFWDFVEYQAPKRSVRRLVNFIQEFSMAW